MEALTVRVCVFPCCLLLCCSSILICSCLPLNTLRCWFSSSFVQVTLRVHPAIARHQTSMFAALCYCQTEAKWHFLHNNKTGVAELPAGPKTWRLEWWEAPGGLWVSMDEWMDEVRVYFEGNNKWEHGTWFTPLKMVENKFPPVQQEKRSPAGSRRMFLKQRNVSMLMFHLLPTLEKQTLARGLVLKYKRCFELDPKKVQQAVSRLPARVVVTQ